MRYSLGILPASDMHEDAANVVPESELWFDNIDDMLHVLEIEAQRGRTLLVSSYRNEELPE